jgi:hypothetical protein
LHLHLLSRNRFIAVMKNDPLLHYSAESFKKYLKKLEWRVKNNLYFAKTSGSGGFLKREEFEGKKSALKKFLFVPYSLTLILPFLESLWLSITRRNFVYLIHLPLTVYTSILIVYHSIMKSLGVNPLLTSYDGSQKILKKWK